jgi:hypothetical protein
MKVCDVMPTAKNINSIHKTYFNLTYIMTW